MIEDIEDKMPHVMAHGQISCAATATNGIPADGTVLDPLLATSVMVGPTCCMLHQARNNDRHRNFSHGLGDDLYEHIVE
jgi:hypothetical protein